jgi:hypothetical protein
MPFIPTPLGLEVTIQQHVNSKDVVNVLHFAQASLLSEAGVVDLAASVADLFVSDVQPHMSGSWQFTGVKVRQLNDNDGIQIVNTPEAPITGARATDIAPNNVALVLTKRTAAAGRSARGRIYIVGVELAPSPSNLALSSWADAIVIAWQAFLADVATANNIVHSVLSLHHNGVARTEGELFPVTSVSLRNKRVDSQRRRLPKD